MTRPPAPKRPGGGRRGGASSAPRKISTLLVDDHELVRKGVRALLEAEDDLSVVGEAEDGREAVAMALRLRPDVIVMDIAMSQLNGIEASRQILDAWPAARVLVLSAHSDEEYVERFLSLGVAGYVLKQASLDILATAIREVHAGRPYFCRRISGDDHESPGGRIGPRAATPARLTSREAEILQLIAEGKANKQSAARLGISIKTVEKHRQSLMAKLDIHDVAGLTRYAIAIGSIEGRNRSPTS